LIKAKFDNEIISIKINGDMYHVMAECFAGTQVMIADVFRQYNCPERIKKLVIRKFINDLEEEFLHQ